MKLANEFKFLLFYNKNKLKKVFKVKSHNYQPCINHYSNLIKRNLLIRNGLFYYQHTSNVLERHLGWHEHILWHIVLNQGCPTSSLLKVFMRPTAYSNFFSCIFLFISNSMSLLVIATNKKKSVYIS